MKQIIVFFFTIAFLNCCNEAKDNILTLSINNQSDFKIEKIKLYANIGLTMNTYVDSILIDKIEISQKYNTEWDLNNLSKVDGNFIIKFQIDTLLREKEFGYFTNGTLIEKKYDIRIENDTILITK